MKKILEASNRARLLQIISLLACSFCLLIPALYNGYPLVTPDSGMYILSGWKLLVPIDRPIAYGVFIWLTTFFGLSLWGVVWAQTFILVYYLKRITKKLLGSFFKEQYFFAIIILLSTLTTVPWFCGQVMPDIFISILILAIVDFYLTPQSNLKSKIISFFLLWAFMQMHNSHLLIALIFCMVARFYAVITKKKWFIKKTLFLFGVTLFSFISISFINLWGGNRFRPSAGSHVFIMARMAENGILDEFLKEYCPTEHYSLCNFQGRTGNRYFDFMWKDSSHLKSVGGWAKAEKEYNTIILRTLIRPKYLGFQFYESIEGTLRQLSQFSVEFVPQQDPSPPFFSVQAFYSREVKEYITSIQQSGQLMSIVNIFNVLSLIFCLLCIVAVALLYDKKNKTLLNWNFVVIIFLAFAIINAFVTSAFSTVYCRLESRVLWLLPFACILYFFQYYFQWKEKSSQQPLPE